MSKPMRILAAWRRGALITGALAAAALAAPAGAAAAVLSSNWAGYVARPASGAGFTSVSASWTEPAAACRSGRETHSAVWVGLGGYRSNARALEQIGSDADCSASGRAAYSSWVELLPAGATTLALRVHPGDRLTASVTVRGHHATLRLRNLTTGKRYSTTRRLADVDVSTADWIVEAPSGCDARGRCETLALTNFGTVAFTDATATASGHTGTVADAGWRASELLLRQDGTGASGLAHAIGAVVSATPSADANGSFTVAYGVSSPSRSSEAPALPGFSGGGPP